MIVFITFLCDSYDTALLQSCKHSHMRTSNGTQDAWKKKYSTNVRLWFFRLATDLFMVSNLVCNVLQRSCSFMLLSNIVFF